MFGPGSTRPWLRWLLLGSLLFNGIFVGAYGFAEMRSRRCASGCGPDCAMARRLGFDADQVASMRASYARVRAQMDPLDREVAARRESIVRILSSPSPDEAALFREVDGIAALQARTQKLLLRHLMEQERSLTPTQREEFRKLLSERLCPPHLCGGGLMEGPPRGGCGAADAPGAEDGSSCVHPKP